MLYIIKILQIYSIKYSCGLLIKWNNKTEIMHFLKGLYVDIRRNNRITLLSVRTKFVKQNLRDDNGSRSYHAQVI